MAADFFNTLDPEIAAYVEFLKRGALPLEGSTVADLRAAALALRAGWRDPGPAMHASEDRVFEGCRYRMHRPSAAARLPAILFFHGGGWTLMDIDTHDPIARGLAAASGAAVLSLDYPLAPEAPFPAALDSCVRFTEFVAASPDHLGLNGAVALAGDSAGANLAVGTTLALRDAGRPMPKGLGLFYGAYDCGLDHESYRRYGNGELPFSRARMTFFLDSYVPDQAARRNPLFAPLHADLHGLPPSFLSVASHDALYDENLAMAARLGAAGNAVELKIYPGTIHGFVGAANATGARVAAGALADMGRFLAKALAIPEA